MKKLTWHTEKRIVSNLIPNEKNPRKISAKQIEDLKKSLRKFNLVEIPVIDQSNKVIAGHQRLMVLKLLGRELEEIEVRVPNRKLTQNEYDQYLISSNRIHGEWDWDILGKEFDLDILSISGFDDIDLTKIVDNSFRAKDDDWDDTTELKKIKSTEIKTGNIFMLGRHRLICGDATDRNVVDKLMSGAKANMINQDPPFNIKLDYNKGVGGKNTKKDYGGEVDDGKTDSEYSEFIRKMMVNAISVSNKNCHVFYWTDEKYVWLFQTLYKELGINSKRICLWIKNNASPTPQVAFNKVTEFCVYGTIGSPYLSNNVQNLNEIINHDTTTGNNLFEEISNHLNAWMVKRLPSNQYEHPTQKSPLLHNKAIRRCTKINDIVLDLTAGSGSIMSACHQLRRIAYMCDQSPIFCQLIINRFKQISNEEVKKIN